MLFEYKSQAVVGGILTKYASMGSYLHLSPPTYAFPTYLQTSYQKDSTQLLLGEVPGVMHSVCVRGSVDVQLYRLGACTQQSPSLWVCVFTGPLHALHTEVGDVVGVADSTIRQSYRLLYPSREILFPDGFVFVTPLDQLPKH